MGHKGHDAIAAWLCRDCHTYMDTQSRNEKDCWQHSEEMLHYCALTILRLWEQGKIR